MDQSTMLVLVISLIIIFTIIILKPLERFSNFRNSTMFHEDTVVNSNALSTPERDYAKYLVDVVLENVNKNYNRHFVLGNLEGVEILPLQDGREKYLIKCFIYTTNEFTNRKFVFDLIVDKNLGVIDINTIYLGSSQSPVMERNGASERGSELYKPLSNPNNLLENVNKTNLDYVDFVSDKEIKNYATDPKERVSDILQNETNLVQNVFPCRIVHHNWDTSSLMKVECPDEKKECFGPYSGTRPPFKVPQYNPTLFEGKQSGAGVYDKMFDLAEDAASRPVGIG